MKLYPDSAPLQLEFDKIKILLTDYCQTEYGKTKASALRIHTKKEFIQLELRQSYEYKSLIQQQQYFPNDYILNIQQEVKLLSIPGAMLAEEQLMQVRKLAESIEKIFRWFNPERKTFYPALVKIIEPTYYEKLVIQYIDEVLDPYGNVKDNASADLQKIRMSLFKKRNDLRRIFEKVVARLNKAGYSADIEESFSNGRRVVAVFSEHKRQIKGILHGESDSRKTAFIEPEETIELNNEVYSLEHAEKRELQKILRALTAHLSVYGALLQQYLEIAGEYDFIRAKGKLAMEINGNFPAVADKAQVSLIDAYHPLLFIYHKKAGKPTIPVTIRLDEKNRILIISGPNAGGKTVTMKTIGLIQMMMQSGLLVPVNPDSEMGIFKQLLIHIGDTQSIEFELSTYSSHLLHMKYFIENANGKTLFFIDELGSGSDPNLGGAFAEVILEELSRRHAIGIVTTHYLNLKVMANHTSGILNGAMSFDEKNLMPLYKLAIGKPGSSYTFSIAERIGLPQHLINRARKLVDEDHFRLDKLLNSTEQDLQLLHKEKLEVQQLKKENEKQQKQLETLINRGKHEQQVELLKHQNKISEEKLMYLKEMDRKMKQIILDWKKSENKQDAVRQIQNLLFNKNEKTVTNKLAKKIESKYTETNNIIEAGSKVKMKKNHQIGIVLELRGKKAIVQIGMLPMTVDIKDLVQVEEKKISSDDLP